MKTQLIFHRVYRIYKPSVVFDFGHINVNILIAIAQKHSYNVAGKHSCFLHKNTVVIRRKTPVSYTHLTLPTIYSV